LILQTQNALQKGALDDMRKPGPRALCLVRVPGTSSLPLFLMVKRTRGERVGASGRKTSRWAMCGTCVGTSPPCGFDRCLEPIAAERAVVARACVKRIGKRIGAGVVSLSKWNLMRARTKLGPDLCLRIFGADLFCLCRQVAPNHRSPTLASLASSAPTCGPRCR
jgi:hypothetical protein